MTMRTTKKFSCALAIAALSCSDLAYGQTVTLVKDINPGSGSSLITTPVAWGDRTFMSAKTATSGMEPWSTNGTSSTTMALDIWPGIQNSDPRYWTVFMDHLVFVARRSGSLGDRLFAIPRSSSTIHEVVPTNFSTAFGTEKASEILGLHAHQNKLYVVTNANGSGAEIHVWQTTPGPQFFLGNLGSTGKLIANAVGGVSGGWGNDPVPSREWYWLGIIRDIHPSGGSDPSDFITLNDKVCFTADNGTTGRELWVTDGTSSGTSLLKDISPGTGSSGITNFVKLGTKLYFVANDGVKGRELWMTDGTTAGTTIVKDINTQRDAMSPIALGITSGSNPTGIYVWNNKLYFNADNGANGSEIWCSDGTAAGTVMLKDINATAGVGSSPKNFSGYLKQGLVSGVMVNKAYLTFTANDGIAGEELWQTDGTAAGTALLKDVKAGTLGSSPSELRGLNNSTTAGTVTVTHYYYSAIGGSNGRELWEFHPMTGTHKKVSPAVAPNANPLAEAHNWPWVQMGNALYFYANYDSNGGELWKVSRP